MKFALILFFPACLFAECNLFIHHIEYGDFGRSCHSISSSYADSIYQGLERERSFHKWYKHSIPDSLCQELENEHFGVLPDSSFCPRFMGMLRYNDKNYFIQYFSYFYSEKTKKIFPIRSARRLKKYLMSIEYFRKNYRDMKD